MDVVKNCTHSTALIDNHEGKIFHIIDLVDSGADVTMADCFPEQVLSYK